MLARAAEARDGTTGAHIYQVRDVAAELARAMGVDADEAERIGWSAMLHDVGKLRVPDRILLKPGSLDAGRKRSGEADQSAGGKDRRTLDTELGEHGGRDPDVGQVARSGEAPALSGLRSELRESQRERKVRKDGGARPGAGRGVSCRCATPHAQ